jgi:hypothetical protein
MEGSKFFVSKVGSSKKVLSLSKTKTQSTLKDTFAVDSLNIAVKNEQNATDNHNDSEVHCPEMELVSNRIY